MSGYKNAESLSVLLLPLFAGSAVCKNAVGGAVYLSMDSILKEELRKAEEKINMDVTEEDSVSGKRNTGKQENRDVVIECFA